MKMEHIRDFETLVGLINIPDETDTTVTLVVYYNAHL